MMLQGKLRTRQLKVTAYLIILAILTPLSGRAQDSNTTNPPPKSPEVQRLEEESARAKLRKDIAEANKAEFDARFPKPTSTPLAGTTTINDTAVIEGQMVGYVSMARAANRIIGAIKANRTIDALAIYNERDVNLLLSYKVARSQVEALRAAFCDLICPPPPAATRATTAPVAPLAGLPIAQSFLGGFVDLTSFLRTNVDIKGSTFAISEGPLVAEVFRAARRTDGLPSTTRMYYPYVFPPNINPATKSQILDRIEEVRDLRINAAKFINDAADIDQKIAKAKAKAEQLGGSLETLGAKQREATGKAQRLLDIYCQAIAHAPFPPDPIDPNDPPPDASDTQAALVIKRIDLAEKKCRTLPAEKRDQLYELRDLLKQAIADKADARKGLKAATNNLTALARDRETLRSRLHGELKDRERSQLLDGSLSRAARQEVLGRVIRRVGSVLSADEQNKVLDLSVADAERNQLLDKLNYKPSVDDAVAFLKAYSDQFDKFVTTIVQADAAVGVNPLTSYIRAENLRAAMNIPDDDRPSNTAYWLQLAVLNAGGNNRIKTNLIWDIFTGGNRLSHSGGAIVQYSLFNSEGQVVASDTITEYTNYIKSDKIKRLPCPMVDDYGNEKKPDCIFQ